MPRAVVYVRQSRNRDYERTVSPDVQRDACLALQAVRACDSVTVVVDLDVSGKSVAGRRGFQHLVEVVKSGQADVVAMYDQSRAFRSTRDAIDFYVLIEQRPAVEVSFVHGNFDRSPAGEFTYTALAAAHALERRMVAEKMRDAIRYRQGRGEMVGAVPFGYRRTVEGTVSRDELAATIVQRLFREYGTGNRSVAQLASRLNAEGVQGLESGKRWRGDTIGQLLANVAYTGRTYTESRRRQRGRLIEARWDALVDAQQFEAVQTLLKSRARRRAAPSLPDHTNDVYIFRGLLRCACGRKMWGQRDGDRLYYRCPGSDAAIPCRQLVSERVLAKSFLALLRNDRQHNPEASPSEGHLRGSALARIDSAMARLGMRFQWGHLSEVSYRREWDGLLRKRNRLSPKMPSESAVAWRRWEVGDAKARRAIVLSMFDQLVVDGGSIVEGRRSNRPAADESIGSTTASTSASPV